MMTMSTLVLAAVLAQSSALAQTAAPVQPAGAEDALKQGLQALNANQPAAAEPLLRTAVAGDPSNLEAQFNLALVLGMEGKDAEAIAAYRQALTLKPALFEADLNLGIILLRDKQPADALPVLKEATETKPAEYRPTLFYAQSLYDTGDYVQAEKWYRQAATIDAKSAAANLGIARSLLKQGKPEDSAPFFRSAATLNPDFKNALLELGSEYDKEGQNAEAIAIYKEFPANQAAASRLSQLLLESNKAAEAIPGLEAEVKRAPTTNNRMALIDAYRQSNQKPKALEQLQLAVAADEKNFVLRMAYGRMLRDERQFPEASRQFEAAAAIQPESVPAWNELAGVLILAEQYDDGIAALDRVRALGKEIPGDLYLRAITLDKLRRNKPALAAYQQFLAVAGGKYPNEEFLSRQRVRILEKDLGK
jgi:tetratricopeptide (TPR) repeat protein